MSAKTKSSKPKFLVSVEVRGEGYANGLCDVIEAVDGITNGIIHDSMGYTRIPEKSPIYEIQVDGKTVNKAFNVPGLGFALQDMLKGRKSLTVTIVPHTGAKKLNKKPASNKQASVAKTAKPRKNKVK